MSNAHGSEHWPTELRLKSAEKALEGDFDNGARFRLAAEYLRVESPSAEVQGHGPGEKQLVAGRAEVGILRLEPVGNYAVRIVFDDLHDTGIYTWNYLYELGEQRDERQADQEDGVRDDDGDGHPDNAEQIAAARRTLGGHGGHVFLGDRPVGRLGARVFARARGPGDLSTGATGYDVGDVLPGGVETCTGFWPSEATLWIAAHRALVTGDVDCIDRVDLKTKRTTVALRAPRGGVCRVAFAAHTLWVLLRRPVRPMRFEVAQINAGSGSIRYFRISGHPGLIAASAGGLWISGSNSLRFMDQHGSVSRIASLAGPRLRTTSAGSVWVSSRHSLLLCDAHSHRPLGRVDLGGPTTALTAAAGRVWVTVNPANAAVGFSRLLRINAHTGRISGRRVLSRSHKTLVEPTSIAANRTHVWLGISGIEISAYQQTILRLDAASLARERVFTLK